MPTYHYDTELNVPEVAEILDCKETYVYRAIRNERIKALDTKPTRVRFDEVTSYVQSQLPPNWQTYFKPEQVA
jgi:excisionase family DNA binding protein